MKSKLGITLVAVGCMSWLGLSGCSQPAAMASVKKKFPNCEVINVPGESYKWLIRMPDGSVRYIFNATGGDGIDEVEIFSPLRKS